jgi:type II secretory pathway pseudopilin PulG
MILLGAEAARPRDAARATTRGPSRSDHHGRNSDSGFGLVEFMISALVISVVVLAAIGVLTRTVESVGTSRQRQAAAAMATQALEQLRGLPYSMVTAGLRNDDLAGDPDISTASGTPRLVLPASATNGAGIDEQLVINDGTSAIAPLYPHRVVVPNSTFRTNPTLSVFVTLDPANPGVYDLAAVVRWTPQAGEAEQTYVQRSKLFSPVGSGGA